MNISTLQSNPMTQSALDALPTHLRRQLTSSRNETHRPVWATDEKLQSIETHLRRSLMAAGWTATMRMLADAAKLINVPEDEVILREYVTKLEAFPADVLERARSWFDSSFASGTAATGAAGEAASSPHVKHRSPRPWCANRTRVSVPQSWRDADGWNGVPRVLMC